MKKGLIVILAVAVVLSLGMTSAFAAGPGAGRNCSAYEQRAWGGYGGICYTDENADGICDYCGSCRQSGAAPGGRGPYFVDENQDGICDRSCGGCCQSFRRGGPNGYRP